MFWVGSEGWTYMHRQTRGYAHYKGDGVLKWVQLWSQMCFWVPWLQVCSLCVYGYIWARFSLIPLSPHTHTVMMLGPVLSLPLPVAPAHQFTTVIKLYKTENIIHFNRRLESKMEYCYRIKMIHLLYFLHICQCHCEIPASLHYEWMNE